MEPKLQARTVGLEPTSACFEDKCLIHSATSAILWSPRRDLNSHKTLTAGVALPLSYAGPKIEDRESRIVDRPPLRCYPLFSILYPQSQWSEPESNGPLLLFRQALIRLSYPTSAAGRNWICVDEFRKLAPDPLGHGSERGGDYGTRTHPSGLQDPHAANNI
jgi:hypothetical protein